MLTLSRGIAGVMLLLELTAGKREGSMTTFVKCACGVNTVLMLLVFTNYQFSLCATCKSYKSYKYMEFI